MFLVSPRRFGARGTQKIQAGRRCSPFPIYREEKLAIRRRSARKRAIKTRPPMIVLLARTVRWLTGFMPSQLMDGRQFRILATCAWGCLALVAECSLCGQRLHENRIGSRPGAEEVPHSRICFANSEPRRGVTHKPA
jgi:hypothetical protein